VRCIVACGIYGKRTALDVHRLASAQGGTPCRLAAQSRAFNTHRSESGVLRACATNSSASSLCPLVARPAAAAVALACLAIRAAVIRVPPVAARRGAAGARVAEVLRAVAACRAAAPAGAAAELGPAVAAGPAVRVVAGRPAVVAACLAESLADWVRPVAAACRAGLADLAAESDRAVTAARAGPVAADCPAAAYPAGSVSQVAAGC